MTIQILALVKINEDEPEALGQYLAATLPLLKSVGGEIVKRFTTVESIVGQSPSEYVMIVNYPSREAVDLVFKSEIYAQIIPIRDKAFSEYHVSVVAGEELA